VFRQLAAGVPDGARLMDSDALKQNAAAAAVAMVQPNMLVGLGTGTTARHAIRLLGERFREGLRFTGVPTSMASAELAGSFGIPLIESPTDAPIDLTIDGADEISEADLTLIKGMGGALLREKIVAVTSRRLVIIADESKLSPRLSGRVPVPIEVVTFGSVSTKSRLAALGCRPVLKRDAQGEPFQTDSGNLIFNCKFDALPDPVEMERALSSIVGVVETGLFIGLATTALVAGPSGVRQINVGGA
jgi:ribose 5-phosphate isomerase A